MKGKEAVPFLSTLAEFLKKGIDDTCQRTRADVPGCKKQKALMLDGLIRPTVKPDLDNFAKLVLDSLNGYAYHDDAQVVVFKEPFCKFYAEKPFIGVIIDVLSEEESRLEIDQARRIFNAD